MGKLQQKPSLLQQRVSFHYKFHYTDNPNSLAISRYNGLLLLAEVIRVTWLSPWQQTTSLDLPLISLRLSETVTSFMGSLYEAVSPKSSLRMPEITEQSFNIFSPHDSKISYHMNWYLCVRFNPQRKLHPPWRVQDLYKERGIIRDRSIPLSSPHTPVPNGPNPHSPLALSSQRVAVNCTFVP